MPDISYPVGGGSGRGYLAVPSPGSARQEADAEDAWQRIHTFFGKYLEEDRTG
jgi:hypothetical protein